MTQEDLVHVDLEDLLLGEHVLQLEGQQHFVDLARVALLCRQIYVARDLHGDRGRTLALGLTQIGQRCTDHAAVVDPVVFKEAGVLNGQHRILHHRWNLVEGQQVAPLFTELANQLAIGGEHAKRQLRAVVGQTGHFGKIGVGDSKRDAHGHQHSCNTCHRQSGQTHHQATGPKECGASGRY